MTLALVQLIRAAGRSLALGGDAPQPGGLKELAGGRLESHGGHRAAVADYEETPRP